MKWDSEKIFLAVLGLALLALLIHRFAPPAVVANAGAPAPVLNDAVLTEDTKPARSGPSYLIAAAPWGFAPPVGNFLPQTVAGMAGATQIVTQTNTLASYSDAGDCGCGGL